MLDDVPTTFALVDQQDCLLFGAANRLNALPWWNVAGATPPLRRARRGRQCWVSPWRLCDLVWLCRLATTESWSSLILGISWDAEAASDKQNQWFPDQQIQHACSFDAASVPYLLQEANNKMFGSGCFGSLGRSQFCFAHRLYNSGTLPSLVWLALKVGSLRVDIGFSYHYYDYDHCDYHHHDLLLY